MEMGFHMSDASALDLNEGDVGSVLVVLMDGVVSEQYLIGGC
jgi:hypothetical protein